MNFPELGIIYTILGILKRTAKVFIQKGMTMLPKDRYCVSEQFGISFAKFGPIFK